MKSSMFFVIPLLSLLLFALSGVFNSSFGAESSYGFYTAIAACGLLLGWCFIYFSRIKGFFALKGTKNRMSSHLSTLIVIGIVVGAGLLSVRPRFNKRVDVTENQVNTLAPQSKKLAAKMAGIEGLQILGFFQDEGEKDRFQSLLSLYQAQGLSAKIEYIDPQVEPTRAIQENITLTNTVVLKNGQSQSRLTEFTEEKLTNALIKLENPAPKNILFVQGHGQASIDSEEGDGLSILINDLKNYNYHAKVGSLLSEGLKAGEEEGKEGKKVDLVVLAGPQYDLKEGEISVLKEYLTEGGSLLVLADAMVALPQLNSFLNQYGLNIENDLILLDPKDPRASLIGQNSAIITEFDAFDSMTKDFAARSGTALILEGARSVTVMEDATDFKVRSIAKTSENMIAVTQVASQKDLANLTEDRIKEGPFGVIAVATGMSMGDEYAKALLEEKTKADVKPGAGKEAAAVAARPIKIVVAGSSQFVTNKGVQRAENFDMAMNMVNFMLKDDNVITLRSKKQRASSLDMASTMSHFNLLLISYVYPFIFLGFGAYIWLRRRSA